MDSYQYKIITRFSIHLLGRAIDKLNEYQKQKELKTDCDSYTPKRWEPCGAVSFINGQYTLPVVLKRRCY